MTRFSEHLPYTIMSFAAGAAFLAFPLQAQDYTVRAGDTLLGIARSELGSAARWRELCEINRDRLEDCDLIFAGMTLRLAPAQGTETVTGAGPEGSTAAPAPVAEDAPASQTQPVAPVQATNMLPNDSLSGARVGTLGDGGSLPDDWFFFDAGGAEATLSVLDVTQDWIDLQITQTGDSGTVFLGFTRRGAYVATTPDQVWTLAVDMAVLSDDGSDNWQANLQGSQWAAQDASSSLGAFVFAADLPLDATLQPYVGSAVTSSADVAFLQADIRFVSAGPWTATYRIGVPTLVKELP